MSTKNMSMNVMESDAVIGGQRSSAGRGGSGAGGGGGAGVRLDARIYLCTPVDASNYGRAMSLWT